MVKEYNYNLIVEALQRSFGKQGHSFQGDKGQILRGTGEQIQYWGIENIKQIFDFWRIREQANLYQGNRYHPLGGPHH